MPEWIPSWVPEPVRQLVEQAQKLPPARQWTLAATAVGSVAFFTWIAFGMTALEYRVLFREVDVSEVSKITDALDSENIPYELAEGGTAVRVPADQVYEARIRMAGQGLPAGSGAGFEIFDEQGFGVTDFVQRVNFRRALQGELSRSIEAIDPIERARVQIALPERTTLVADRGRTPSASVVVRIRDDHELEEGDVQAIVHLVASSVEMLDAEKVTVVDHTGRLLAPREDGTLGMSVSNGAQKHQTRIENDLSERVETILGRIVGPDRVVARVRAELDWTQRETTAESFDPDSQVARSEQIEEEESSDRFADPEGIPGAIANNPEAITTEDENASSLSKRSSEIVNYEISKVVKREVAAPGSIRRLSVAVLVDGKPVQTAGEALDAPADFAPWEADELGRFEDLAKQAVGFDSERGDVITLTSAPFRDLDLGPEPEGLVSPQMVPLVGTLVQWIGGILALLIFARWVVRPLLQATRETQEEDPSVLTAAELEAQLSGEEPGQHLLPELADRPPTLAEQVGEVLREHGDQGARTVRSWLSQG